MMRLYRSYFLFVLLIGILFTGTLAAQEITQPVQFSRLAGFYAEPFALQLYHPNAEVQILYTLDGSEPHASRLNGETFRFKKIYPRDPGQAFGQFYDRQVRTITYSSPIFIQNRDHQPDRYTDITTQPRPTPFQPASRQRKGVVVRARAFIPPDQYSEIYTHTYFVGTHRHSLPVVSISVHAPEFFDYDEGIYVPGADFDQWRQRNPFVAYNDGRPGNYSARGVETERVSHLEFFETSSAPVLSQRVGIRIHGAFSRSFPLKSLRMYARSDYGESRFNHAIFPDNDHNRFNRLLFRHSGQDLYATMFRDAAIQTIVRHLDIETQSYRPVVHYLNGEYWGIINIRERYDRHYLERIYGIDPDNIDLLTFNALVKEGDNLHYRAMLDYIRTNDPGSDLFWDHLSTMMDMENYIDYTISNIFVRNSDWPGNNIDYWRLRTAFNPDAPKGHDGRWRWMVYDTDFGFNRYSVNDMYHNTLVLATQAGNNNWPNPDWSTFLLRSLLQNPAFREAFIIRFSDLLNSAFLPERTTKIIESMKEAIEPEINEHLQRWQTHGRNQWVNHVNNMLLFARERPQIQRGHLVDFFNLGGLVQVYLDVDVQSNEQAGYIRLNTLDLRSENPGIYHANGIWSGTYFENMPLRIEAVALPGYIFTGWAGSISSENPTITLHPQSDVYLTASFEPVGTESDNRILLHGWHFNALPSGNLDAVQSDDGIFSDAVLTYYGEGAGYMDRVSPGSDVLTWDDEITSGYALRVRNPSADRSLRLSIPADGHRALMLNYAVSRTTNGAQWHTVWYRDSHDSDWFQAGGTILVPYIENTFQPVSLSLEDSLLTGSGNLEIEFRFGGTNASGSSGNNRFDNISITAIEGRPVSLRDQYQPVEFQLNQNYPNPFNNSTTISYQMGSPDRITIEIYDSMGRLVAKPVSGHHNAGQFELRFDASSLASGVYHYRLTSSQGVQTRKMMLLK